MQALLMAAGRLLGAVAVATVVAYAITASGAQLPRPPGAAAAESILEDRLAAYVDLRSELARLAELPLEPTEARTAAAQRRRLGMALRTARADVPPGNIFNGIVATYFRRIAAEALDEDVQLWLTARAYEATGVDRARVSLPLPLDAAHDVHLALLHALPPLPTGIEYRVLHLDLLLWDVQADVVIDVLPGVFAVTTV